MSDWGLTQITNHVSRSSVMLTWFQPWIAQVGTCSDNYFTYYVLGFGIMGLHKDPILDLYEYRVSKNNC